MISVTEEAIPIRLTNFFLSTAGFAIPDSRNKQIVANVATMYSTIVLSIAFWICAMDIYHCWGSFHEFVYSFIAFGTSGFVGVKFTAFMCKKKKYLRLMKYAREILWTKHQHNEYEKYVMKECAKEAMYFTISFICMSISTSVLYTVQPLILNIGRNETDRLFPVPLWINLPIHITPWYEIAFFIVVLAVFQTGICYFCFDMFLALTNIFITGQFKILKHRLEILFDTYNSLTEFYNEDGNMQRLYLLRRNMIKKAHHEFKRCVKQHQILIDLVEDVEDIYSVINLLQVLTFSFFICLLGYQLILPGNSATRRILFMFFLGGCLTQLFALTFTCTNLTIAGAGISGGPGISKWYTATWCEEGRSLVRDLKMVIIRAQRPCQLTAFGFWPITLETFRSVLAGAFSYLTLMRNTGY